MNIGALDIHLGRYLRDVNFDLVELARQGDARYLVIRFVEISGRIVPQIETEAALPESQVRIIHQKATAL